MLSFGYTLLTYDAVAAVETAGLDTSIGMLHQPHGNRPALALDLIEELRPVVVDAMVLRCIHTGMIKPADFDTTVDVDGQPRCLLNDAARRIFISAYERRMLTLFTYARAAARVSYRQALHGQAAQLVDVFMGRQQTYLPIAWK